MRFQSRNTSGLFDPREVSVMWPEPNDDPNIPYNWGLNGFKLKGGGASCSSIPQPSSTGLFTRSNGKVENTVKNFANNDTLRNATVSSVAGAYGIYQSYSNNNTTMENLKNGAIFATGGFIVSFLVGKLI